MKEFPKKQILINYVLGICTPGEREDVEEWLDREPGNVRLLQQVAAELSEEEDFTPLYAAEKQEIKQSVLQQVRNDGNGQNRVADLVTLHERARKAQNAGFASGAKWWLKVAAMILVISTAGLTSVFLGLDLNFGAQEASALQERTLSNGQTATLRFADGSVIKLNGGSTIRYPEHFEADRREVYLEGEAFFTIAHDPSRPFTVHTPKATTRVLGTSFNVKAYQDEEELQVVVADGKVAVTRTYTSQNGRARTEQDSIVLEKDQWVTYRVEGRLVEKGEGNIWEMIAWKDRVLVFNNKKFSEVAAMLERWYGVEVEFKAQDMKDIVLHGEHDDASLEEVLNSIRYVTGMAYTMDAGVVTIKVSDESAEK